MNTHKRIQQYLNQATRGLWGKNRKQVREELYAHIFERMHHHMAFGKSEAQALDLSLKSLGTARTVNAGLLKTHSFPALGKGMVSTALLGTLLVTQAQHFRVVDVFQKTPPCLSDSLCFPASHYIHFKDLAPILAKLDLTAEIRMEGMLQKSPALYLNGENVQLSPTDLLGDNPETALVNVSTVLAGLYHNKGVKISGLFNPEMEFQDTRIKFENKTTPYDASDFYRSLVAPAVENKARMGVVILNDEHLKRPSRQVTLHVPGAKDGEVYGLLQKPDAAIFDHQGNPLNVVSLVLGEAKNGQVNLYANYADLKPTTLAHLKDGDVFLKLSGDPTQPGYKEIFPEPDHITRHF